MLVSVATLSGVLFTPAIPELARAFSLSDSNIQWMMSLFLLGYSFGQLPYGPLANRFGRKKTIYLGLALCFIGTAIVFFSNHYSVFCFGRFIQALGAAVGLKVTFTMIGDLHAGQSATKAIGYITVAFALMQGIGAALGGVLTENFGWRGCFGFLMFYLVFLFLCCTTLPETAKTLDRGALKWHMMLRKYGTQFRDSFTMLHALIMSLSAALIYIFSSEGPIIGIDIIGLSPTEYGLYSLIPASTMAAGTIAVGYFSNNLNPRIGMISGMLVILIGTLIMGLLFSKGILNPWTLFIPTAIIFFGDGFPWTFASSVGLSESTDKSNANAVMQFVNMMGAFFGTLIVGGIAPKNPLSLPAAYAILVFLMILIWLRLRPHHRRLR